MPQERRVPDTDAGEYMVKVRRKKKRKDSKSEMRRAAHRIGHDLNFVEVMKRVGAFLLVLVVLGALAYFFLKTPTS